MAEGEALTLSVNTWGNFAFLLAPVGLMVLLYAPTSRALAGVWNDVGRMTYNHGWLVAAISVWLLFDTSKRFASVKLGPSLKGSLALFMLSVLWLVANRMNVQFVQMTLFPLLCLASLWALYGFDVSRRCVLACAYLFFAVPFWDFFNSTLQWVTVFAVRTMVRLVAIPAYFEANNIHLPDGVITIADGCSGLNFFLAGTALTVLYSHVGGVAHRYRCWALGAALIVLGNWLRVFSILLAGHLTHMQHYLIRVEHVSFGWGVFAAMMALFFFFASRMQQGGGRMATYTPVVKSLRPAAMIAALVAFLSIPAWAAAIERRSAPELLPWEFSNVDSAGWSQVEDGFDWNPVFHNADLQSRVRLRKADQTVDVYLAAFLRQSQNKKLAGYGNSIFGDLQPGIRSTKNDSMAGRFVETELEDAYGKRSILWESYYVGGRWFQTPQRAQFWYGLRSLIDEPISGVVGLRAECSSDCDTARVLMDELVPNLPLGPPNLQR